MTYRVCFVCTGDICRSPMAEHVFHARVEEAGLARTPDEAAKVRLFRSYDPAAGDALDVPDPYYGGREGFEECLEMVEAASEGLLAAVRAGLGETCRSAG